MLCSKSADVCDCLGSCEVCDLKAEKVPKKRPDSAHYEGEGKQVCCIIQEGPNIISDIRSYQLKDLVESLKHRLRISLACQPFALGLVRTTQACVQPDG